MGMLSVLLLWVIQAGATDPVLTGVTFPTERFGCSGERPAHQTRSEWLDFRREAGRTAPQMEHDWVVIDSLAISGEMAPGRRVVFSYDPAAETLELADNRDTLPAACRSAADFAPTWLREELVSAFRRLGDSAGFYANLLLAVPAPYADEVAFCIAKIGPEALTHHAFNPALLLLNAQQLYAIAESLHYAEVVDYGTAPGDYYSTVRYRVLENGDSLWVELPRDIYYYYVVHPTTSDELPRLDDYVYNRHWRDYFFFAADSGFPVLGDYLKQARVVWSRHKQVFGQGRPFTPEAGALDVIGNWVTRTVVSGASGNRPIHPNVIAHEHNGNCGEIQDVWTAACRTGLIPVLNASDPCEDHVWNEFFDDGWYPLASDPATHIADSGVAYEEAHGGSKRVSAVYNWRPDGRYWTSTGRYSLTCSLYVRVLDLNGLPVDGARVFICSEGWYGGISTSTIDFTDQDGAAAFELGDMRNYYIRVVTTLGEYPGSSNTYRIINLSQTGAVYFHTLVLPWTLAAPKLWLTLFPGDSSVTHKLSVELEPRAELKYGYAIARGGGTGDPDDSIRFYQFYSDKHPGGTMDLSFIDTTGYRRYLNRQRFGALWLGDDIPAQTVEFVAPDDQRYHAVLSSEDKVYLSRELRAGAKLYRRVEAVAEAPASRLLPVLSLSGPGLRLRAGSLTGPWRLAVFDVAGQLRATVCGAGPTVEREWRLPAGVYVVALSVPGAVVRRKAVVVEREAP